MRVAVVSDIHGNLTAFEAVLADIWQCSPDLVLHGGDLADAGSSPVEIVDRIRSLGWPGVMGTRTKCLSSLIRWRSSRASLRLRPFSGT
jgi:Icc-related predicted phosphoesterase